MILKNQTTGTETDIAKGSYVHMKDGAAAYEAHVDWQKLTPATREAFTEIASQAEALRLKSVEILKREFPESCLELALGDKEEMAVSSG